jgi:hypothetical protein
MNTRAVNKSSFGRINVIRPWSNNTRIGCYWLPYVKDTVEIKTTVDLLGLL